MQIREMIKNDMEQLAELYFQFLGDKSDVCNMTENFDLIQKENHHILLCAVDDDKLIGSVMCILCRELYGNCSAFLVLENMIVDKSNRRKGIRKAMLHK
jgi:predicted N-acetyltransferase YhbS